MILTADDPRALKTLVMLDGKPVKHYVSAEEGPRGWIEVVDPSSMAPLDENQGDPWAEDEGPGFTELKTKKVFGTVEFKHLG